jgi:hypothetical protein
MDESTLLQVILVIENYLSHLGFGSEGVRAAQARGWVDQSGRATEEGKQLVLAIADQVGTRSALRNLV